MSRAFARLCLMFAALVMVAFAASPVASAQDVGDLLPGDAVEDAANAEGDADADAEADDGKSVPYNDNHNGLRFVIPDAQPGSGESAGNTGGTGGGDAGAGLALTGTDVEPIVAISAGLLAVGGSALVASRRRLSLFD